MTHAVARVASCAVLSAIVAGFAAAQTPPGACILNDGSFTTADGGCKDLATSAVWSAEVPLGNYAFAETYCTNLVEGGFDDWRMPTVGEMETFCANGAYTHVQTTAPGWAYYIFSEWTQVFETASCVSALVDLIVHKAEIVKIDGKSYREKEARERTERRAKERKAKAGKRRAP